MLTTWPPIYIQSRGTKQFFLFYCCKKFCDVFFMLRCKIYLVMFQALTVNINVIKDGVWLVVDICRVIAIQSRKLSNNNKYNTALRSVFKNYVV